MGGSLLAYGDWQSILSKLAKDEKTGKITEKIQIYTHSRGAAFGGAYTSTVINNGGNGSGVQHISSIDIRIIRTSPKAKLFPHNFVRQGHA